MLNPVRPVSAQNSNISPRAEGLRDDISRNTGFDMGKGYLLLYLLNTLSFKKKKTSIN